MILVPRKPQIVSLTQVGVYVTSEAIYPDIEVSEKAMVQTLDGLSRDETLCCCALINRIVSGSGTEDIKVRQERAINLVLNDDERKKVNEFWKKGRWKVPPTFFFRGQLLELVRWVSKHCKNLPDDGQTFGDAGTRSRFVRCALIATGLWNQRIFGDKLDGIGDANIDEARLKAAGPFWKAFEEANPAPQAGETLGHGWAFFSAYFPKRYPEFEAEFKRITGLSVEEYFVCLAGVSIKALVGTQQDIFFQPATFAAATAYKELFPKFLVHESQSPEQLAEGLWTGFEKHGYRAIRERPILVTANKTAVVLDPIFFGERISIGPLFQITAQAGRGANEVFGRFGSAFEDYVNDMLHRVYPSAKGLVDRLACNVKGADANGEFEVDNILNDVKDVVVSESKSVWLKEGAILSDDFLEEIRLKYSETKTSIERRKGVSQLARIVRAIVNDVWKGQNEDFKEARRIFPVLIAHDTKVATLGAVLAKEFDTLLGVIPHGRRVEKLVVLTLADLEHLEASLENFSLVKFLEDYSNAVPDRVTTVHNFLTQSAYTPKLRPSQALLDMALALLTKAQAALFPKEPAAG
jgi:hypothetical protein